MNMVGRAVDRDGLAAIIGDDAGNIFEQLLSEAIIDQRPPLFGSEDYVIN